MKILVICQYYYPEPFRITDICEELVKHGNDVTVVTGTPNYPNGKVYPGYERSAHKDEVINGVTIHRCIIHPRKTGAIHRLWNYYSYSFASSKYIEKLDQSFDVVFIYQLSPVMMANAGIKYAKKHGKKSLLYCLDLWPASLNAYNVNGGLIYNKWFYRESKKVYESVDKILISSKSFASYFKDEFGIDTTEYVPQYSEEAFTTEDCKKNPNEYTDLMFAGNIGSAQSVDTIIRAAALCKDISRLRWHIVGDGKELDNCKRLAEELDAPVVFYGRKTLKEMPAFYAMADAMLITMKKEPIISLTLPGKIQSYMAARKPIIGAIDGEAHNVILNANAGLVCEAEDENGLAECVKQFMNQDTKLFGQNAYTYYSKHFSKAAFIKKLKENMLNACFDD